MTDENVNRLKDELLRKIGRNVLLFQKAEQLLKILLRVGSIAGGVSELESAMNMRTASIQNQTMVVGSWRIIAQEVTTSRRSPRF